MSINDLDQSTPRQEEAKEIKHPDGLDAPATEDLQIKAIAQVVGLEDDSEFELSKEKLQTLLDYAKSQTKDHSPESLKWAIRVLETKTGTPPFGERLVSYLARYAYLVMEKSKIDQELGVFTGGLNG